MKSNEKKNKQIYAPFINLRVQILLLFRTYSTRKKALSSIVQIYCITTRLTEDSIQVQLHLFWNGRCKGDLILSFCFCSRFHVTLILQCFIYLLFALSLCSRVIHCVQLRSFVDAWTKSTRRSLSTFKCEKHKMFRSFFLVVFVS